MSQMHLEITKEKAILLDNLIKTTNTETITFDFNFLLEIQLITPDISQLTIMKIEPIFFESYSEGTHLFSIPIIKFYKENMTMLHISMSNNEVVFKYTYNKISHIRKVPILSLEIFDLDFVAQETLMIDLHGLESILNPVIKKNTKLTVQLGKYFLISEKSFSIKVRSEVIKRKIEFSLDGDRFMKICNISKYFNESYLSVPEETSPINMVLKTPELIFSTFLSV